MDGARRRTTLAYLGDGLIGAGAKHRRGTIFCNYDG